MSGGWKDLVLNPNERILSSDMNRLQTFKEADLGELFRALFNTDADNLNGDDVQPGVAQQVTSATSPAAGDVIDGLQMLPHNSTLDISITPGRCFIFDPDSVPYNGLTPNPDESGYKYVNDPGLAIGTLQMAANASGQTRVDVIECARTGIGYAGAGFTVLETDNRDIFNPITGAFSASTVNKVVAGQMQYRVRQGIPGAGFPGTVQGWLPLAVASVPNGTTANSSITFWDVRPLVSDRVLPPFKTGYATGRIFHNTLQVDPSTVFGAGMRLVGRVDCVAADWLQVAAVPGMRRLGGDFHYGPQGGLSLTSSSVLSGAGVADGPAFLYLMEPFGLPRWCKYNTGTSRSPFGPRGIPVVSNILPAVLNGSPVAAVQLPSGLGLGNATATMGLCVMALKYSGGAPIAMTSDGRSQWINAIAGVAYSRGDIVSTGLNFAFTASPGSPDTNNQFLGYPPNAKALYVLVSVTIPVAANTFITAGISLQTTVAGQTAWTMVAPSVNLSNPLGGTQPMVVSGIFKVPVPDASASWTTTPPSPIGFTLIASGGSGAATECKLQVLGWDTF